MMTDGPGEMSKANEVDMVVMSAEDALLAMQSGEVPTRLRVEGNLFFYQQHNVAPPRALPTEELIAGDIIIHDASQLTQWPRVVRCRRLYLWNYQRDFAPESRVEFSPLGDENYWSSGELNMHDCKHVTNLPQLSGAIHELRLDSLPLLKEIPSGLHITRVIVRNCPELAALPGDLTVSSLDVSTSPRLGRLPDVLHANTVSLADCEALTTLPDDFVVVDTLNLSNCINLTRLPDNLATPQLNIAQCHRLTALPEGLRSIYVDMSGCAGITRWDDSEVTTVRQLSARGCANLESLPPNLRQIDELDVSGCARLTRLPDELRITRWIDVGESGVKTLPASARGTQVRWNGVNVTGQVAFHPETLTANQALTEENAELRRVMLERIGTERFVAEAQPQDLDADTDSGGPRRLLRIEVADDEPLIALQVYDPSTGRQYLLRVPPDIETCRQAAAWIAGFDNPDDYQPIMET